MRIVLRVNMRKVKAIFTGNVRGGFMRRVLKGTEIGMSKDGDRGDFVF